MEILRKDSITGFRVASDEYSEPSRTSKLELFSKIVNGWKPLTIFAESFILDVRLGSEYVSEHYAFSFFFFFWKIESRFSTLCEKCPYVEFFWFVFSRSRTEYGDILSISPYSVQMRENTDQKNSEYGHFSRSARF